MANQRGEVGAQRIEREADVQHALTAALVLGDVDRRDPEQVPRERVIALLGEQSLGE